MASIADKSDSEETVPVLKSIFKKRATTIPDFDVSLDESNTKHSQCNKSDTSLTISAPKKNSIFEKARQSSQHRFSVNFDESNINSENELSVTFSKSKLPFKQKKVSDTNNVAVNQFNVTFSETNTSVGDTLEKTSEDVDDESTYSISLANKPNPFKKPKPPPRDMFNIDYDETNNDDNSAISTNLSKVVFKKSIKPSDQFQVSFNETNNENNELINEPTDKTQNKLFLEDSTKENVFMKAANKNIKDAFNVEFEESNFGDDTEVTSSVPSSKFLFKVPTQPAQNFEVSFSPTVSQVASQWNESRNESKVNGDSKINVTAVDSTANVTNGEDVEPTKKSFINNSTETAQEMNEERSSLVEGQQNERISLEVENSYKSLDNLSNRNLSDQQSRSEMYLEQSSINDENLNNWMSDHSDEEIQPPTPPVVSRYTSFTEEAPQSVKPVSPTQTITLTWEQKFNEIVSKATKKNQLQESHHLNSVKLLKSQDVNKPKPGKVQKNEDTKKSQPPKLLKPAPFATKRLYQYIIRKLEPKYGIDTILQSEQIVSSICDTVKKVQRRKTHQKKLIQDLKKEMASVGLIETTVDFYEFVIKFLPNSFRVKVIPCVQPVTNTVFPPKDTTNPFDKIL